MIKNKKVAFIFIILFVYSSICFGAIPDLYSNAAVLIDADSGYILASKNGSQRIYPASTTKVLTSILAIENLDIDSPIVVTKSGVNIPWDSSKVYLKEQEVMSVRNLLYCTLITSGNDAANMLGEAVSGSIDKFVELMNKKALELGCKNTHFANAHGYHNKDHYTTAEDMGIILRYAMQNDTFRQICETKKYTVPKTNLSEQRDLTNTNRLILSKEESPYAFPYKYALGGKTGYTSEAGRCLVGWAKNGEKTLICCVFGGPTEGKEDRRYLDCVSLFEYGFNNFENTDIIDRNSCNFEILDNENEIKYTVGLDKNLSILADSSFQVKEIGYSIDSSNLDIIKNITQSQDKTNVSFFVKDQTGTTSILNGAIKVLSKESLPTFNFDSLLSIILYICVVLILLIIIIAKANKTNNKGQRYRSIKHTNHMIKDSNNINSRKTRRRKAY